MSRDSAGTTGTRSTSSTPRGPAAPTDATPATGTARRGRWFWDRPVGVKFGSAVLLLLVAFTAVGGTGALALWRAGVHLEEMSALTSQLQARLVAMRAAMATGLPKLNALLAEAKLAPIDPKAELPAPTRLAAEGDDDEAQEKPRRW